MSFFEVAPEIIGFLMIGAMLFAIFIGFPISFTLIFLGIVFGAWGFGMKLTIFLMTLQFYGSMMEQTLAAVPLFVFMGFMMEQAGLMERLFKAVQLMLARMTGSLFVAVLFVSVVFGAATGIVGASVTILGIMAAKTMSESGYDVRLAAGTITAGGTLGILIPPSIMLVVMGPVLEVPVTDLFAGAILPGVMMAVLYLVYALGRCWLNPKLGPPLREDQIPEDRSHVWREFILGLVPPTILIAFAMGSILFGWATPTEGAGMGALGSVLLTIGYRKFTWKRTYDALLKTLEISVLILFLVAASNFFGAVFSRLGTPGLITDWLLALDLSPSLIIIMILAMVFILGWPLEWVPIVLIILPILQPVLVEMNVNMTKMTTEEAFVKVLQMHGIEHAFGIIGSAMMPISDLFPKAGIKFWDCAHECNAGMMADGFTRATGKMSMMIAQNGPGITNFVTPVKTAYWNHTPLLLVTPQAANKTIGQGGFQEVEQMALFEDMVCYQEEVRDPRASPRC
jgi:tripartite ATP-independent transporter DctM subunit